MFGLGIKSAMFVVPCTHYNLVKPGNHSLEYNMACVHSVGGKFEKFARKKRVRHSKNSASQQRTSL